MIFCASSVGVVYYPKEQILNAIVVPYLIGISVINSSIANPPQAGEEMTVKTLLLYCLCEVTLVPEAI
jgi:hypothetical protein